MKRYLLILCATAGLYACSQPAAETTDKARFVRAELHNPSSRYVVVVSHRGDWRNWPENSIPAIESVIGMGVDIMEPDLKLTKDSVLVLCHDKTIDRTTNGRGRVCDITYDSIRRCVLKTGHGVKTSLKMPTLREALAVCKDRIAVNIDQGYEYYDLALAITEELGVTDQVLIKGKRPAGSFSRNMPRRASSRWLTKCAGTTIRPKSKPACGRSSQAVRNCGSIRSGTRSAAV